MSRLIISFYDDFAAAHAAVTELIAHKFGLSTISMIAHRATCERTWGVDRARSWFYQCPPQAMQLAGIGSVLVSGFLTGDLNVVEAKQGSLVRALQKRFIPETDAHLYSEGVRRRGILVLVSAERTNSSRALAVLDRYCPVDILELADQWRKMGWTRFDETANPIVDTSLNWPSSITSLPGDGLLYDGVMKNWPQSIVGEAEPFKKKNR